MIWLRHAVCARPPHGGTANWAGRCSRCYSCAPRSDPHAVRLPTCYRRRVRNPESLQTDDRGFIDKAARCDSPKSAVAVGRTEQSLIAICVDGSGHYEYRGVRLKDDSELNVPGALMKGGQYIAHNADFTYIFSAKELMILQGWGWVARKEPMVAFVEPRCRPAASRSRPGPAIRSPRSGCGCRSSPCTRLQCVHFDNTECCVAVGLDPVDQVGFGQQRAAHRDEVEALGHREVHRLAVGDAAEQDQRHLQFGAEQLGVAQQIRLAVGVFAQELLARSAGRPTASAV